VRSLRIPVLPTSIKLTENALSRGLARFDLASSLNGLYHLGKPPSLQVSGEEVVFGRKHLGFYSTDIGEPPKRTRPAWCSRDPIGAGIFWDCGELAFSSQEAECSE
jgi:hypothetical protein